MLNLGIEKWFGYLVIERDLFRKTSGNYFCTPLYVDHRRHKNQVQPREFLMVTIKPMKISGCVTQAMNACVSRQVSCSIDHIELPELSSSMFVIHSPYRLAAFDMWHLKTFKMAGLAMFQHTPSLLWYTVSLHAYVVPMHFVGNLPCMKKPY